MLWRNTNRLLDSGYVGIKTGITKSAGSCFAGCFEAKEEQLIVVALGTASVGARFRETEVLVKAVLGSAYSKF
jgi:D-alanyl-D-alanine carboxypeptidase